MTGWCNNSDLSNFPNNNTATSVQTWFSRILICEAGTIETVRVMTALVGSGALRLAIYSDDGALPDRLLATTDNLAYITDAFISASINPTVDVISGQYIWVGVQAQTGNEFIKTDLGLIPGLAAALNNGTGWTSGSFPDPSGAAPLANPIFYCSIFITESPEQPLPSGTVYVTDGAERIDLNNCGRIYIEDWTPFVPGPKGNGTWRQSSLSPGRQLVDWQWENWVDVFTLGMHNTTQDKLIRQEQDLQRLLIKAHQYWTTDWQNEPVWLETRAPCETHTRYAIIKSWRTPTGSGNPFQQPFSLVGQRKSVIENYQLTVEHGPWLSDQPGTGRCVQISGTQDSYPYHLEFNGDDSVVDCGSDAGLDDLPTAAFTAEGWFRVDSFTPSGGVSFACWKTQWYVQFNSADGVRAFADFATTDAISTSGTDDFDADGEWHHIAVVFVVVAKLYRIFIDGVEVTYPTSQNGVGAYNVDNANDFLIGNSTGLAQGLDGAVGWFRLSNNNRYGATFTPPPRCALPAIDGNTIAQWIGVENSGATIDNQEGTAARDGTQTDCEFDIGCEFGRDETCEEEVYIANKHNRAQLTHIFVDDGGVFGTNLIGETLPFLFLPAVPAVGDIVYFGIDTTYDDSGPFCSLVFDILTAQTDVTGIIWEYWNGAWVSAPPFAVQDNTDTDGAMTNAAFDTTGVKSVHWVQPSDWTTTAVNGVTGYWIRARVTAIGAAPTGPYQQNRDIYTILWPYVEIDDNAILGDIAAKLLIRLDNQSDDDFSNPVAAWQNRVIVGLRSIDRGSDFTAYLNFSDEQNPSNVTVFIYGVGAFATDTEAPSGRVITVTNPAALARVTGIRIFNPLLSQYHGIYRVILRGEQDGGVTDDLSFQLRIESLGQEFFRSDELSFPSTNQFEIIDFGQVTLNVNDGSYTLDLIDLDIYVSGNGATDGRIYDLILIPVDEWSADVVDRANADVVLGGRGGSVSQRSYLIVDGKIDDPRKILTPIVYYDDDDIAVRFQFIGSQPPMLQANSNQRLWFFSTRYPSGSNFNERANIYVSDTVQLVGVQKYLYARGSR